MKPLSPENLKPTASALAGVLIGTAIGDALGLPMEGLSARRQNRLFPFPLRHRLLGSFGMISDDTEHTLMIAQALLSSPSDPLLFQRQFARRLRWWLVSLPAGVGFATLRAILKLWMGFSPKHSGVYSAGNGPAMRVAVLGVYFAHDPEKRRLFIKASTEITHRDPRAEIAAQAVAETAAWMAQTDTDPLPLLTTLEALSDLPEWLTIVSKLRTALHTQQSTADFASQIGAKSGVSGYAFQSAPVAIYAALRHLHDFPQALSEIIACGGDTDSAGAITGALVGARTGCVGIPQDWQNGIVDWPCSLQLLKEVAARLHRQLESPATLGPAPFFWPAIPFRNLAFLSIVLSHGLRRLLPPY